MDFSEQFLRRYRIVRKLGAGAMGEVYLAHDVELDRPLAIKTLSARQIGGREGEARFAEEARITAALQHPSIVRVLDFGTDGDLLYLALEYVEGDTLAAKLRRDGALSPDAFREVAVPVLDAIAYAHSRDVLHRDIKPENVLLDAQGNARVSDFGLAKLRTSAAVRTRTGVLMGTPAYMSPEVGRGQKATAASDQYSLGILLYELIAGHVPFQGDDIFATINMHATHIAPPLEEARPGIPPSLAAAVHRALSKSPDSRWPSVSALANAIKTSRGIVPGSTSGSWSTSRTTDAAHPPEATLDQVITPTIVRRPDRDPSNRTLVGGQQKENTSSSRPASPRAYPSRPITFLASGVILGLILLGSLKPRWPTTITTPLSLAAPRLQSTPRILQPSGISLEESRLQASRLMALLDARRLQLNSDWLGRFVKQPGCDPRKAPKSTAAALREHFDRLAITVPLNQFLARSRDYFADARISEQERWATRCALCDVEVIQYFCEEHHVPWPLGAKVSTCGGQWDQPARVNRVVADLVSDLVGTSNASVRDLLLKLDRVCKQQSYKQGLAEALSALGRGDAVGQMKQVLRCIATRKGRYPVNASMLSACLRLQIVDEYATSVAVEPAFGDSLSEVLGQFGARPSSPAISVASTVCGSRPGTPIKVNSGGRWMWELQTSPFGGVMLVLVVNDFDPKVVLSLNVNGRYYTTFRNADAAAGGPTFSVPRFWHLEQGQYSEVTYTRQGPLPQFVALGRWIPDGVFRKGSNLLTFEPIALPGPLKLPRGQSWSFDLESGSLWNAFLVEVGRRWN